MTKKTISFLFGAGAEADFGLPKSIEYIQDSFFCGKTNKIVAALKQFFSSEDKKKKRMYFDETYSYNASTLMSGSDIYRKVVSTLLDDADEKEKSDKQKIQDDDVNCFKDIFTNFVNNENLKEVEVSSELLKKVLKVKTENNRTFLRREDFESQMQISFASFLDGYFHTIINPKKYGSVKFSKVFNYYWSCFFSIADSLILSKKIHSQKFKGFFNSKNEIDHLKILQDIQGFINILYNETKIDYEGSYYSEIKKQLENRKKQFECKGAVTTNYFKFVEESFSGFAEVSYINGKLKWFEFPELLEVRDFSSPKETPASPLSAEHIFFPFIFGQSYLKPVVDKRQTEEFHKFGKILDHSDILVVLGYNINEDDNHVNSFIHDYLNNKNKRLVFVTENSTEDDIRKKLKAESLLGEIKIAKANFEKEKPAKIVKSIFSQCE